MDFVAIDFETANSSRNSACSLGAVLIENGKIVQRKYSLINPEVPFHRFCTYIHGITEETVQDAPTFSQIHKSVFDMLDGHIIVAHNAGFDMAVLADSCRARGLAVPNSSSFCSVEMARKAWPEMSHHKLNSLCTHFNIPLKHHNAIEDATACAQIVLICAEQFGAKNIDELQSILAKKAKRDAERRKAELAALRKMEEEARSEVEAQM